MKWYWKVILPVALMAVGFYFGWSRRQEYIRRAMSKAELEPGETAKEATKAYEAKVNEIAAEMAAKDAAEVVLAWQSRFGKR